MLKLLPAGKSDNPDFSERVGWLAAAGLSSAALMFGLFVGLILFPSLLSSKLILAAIIVHIVLSIFVSRTLKRLTS